MATDVGQGDSETVHLDVTPADGSTVATLTVHKPDGTSEAWPVTAGAVVGTGDDATQRWAATAPVVFDQPGRWVLHWDVAGTGEGAEDHEVYVVASPVAGGPAWTPGRSRVANYVPGRTLVAQPAGSNASLYTFDSTTRPTGVVVDRLIADAVAWVQAATGTVHANLHDLAAATSAVFAAAMVEQGYPDRDAATKTTSADTAAALLAQARTMRDDLATANADLGDDWSVGVLPYYSFPPPVSWGDSYL